VFNPHHRRAWKNSYTALSALGKMITEFESDPSNTSQELMDQAQSAYIIVQDVQLKLSERRTADNEERAAERIRLKNAPKLPATKEDK
jgi:hypothetical protein